MIRSMTGYGRHQEVIESWDISVELKSVNHRYFEFSCRLPRNYSYLEDKLKSMVQSKTARGKIDLYLSIASTDGADSTVKVNRSLAKAVLNGLNELSAETGLENDVTLYSLARFPDIFTIEKAKIDEDEIANCVFKVASQAIDRFVQMRHEEGERLKKDLLSRLDNVALLVAAVEKQSPQTVENYRQKLYSKISSLLSDRTVDESRVITEVAIFADRVAVDEETVRLKSHIEQFKLILEQPESVGRKLDFLTQELNREANTIGSKAQDSSVANVVIELKSELEKIREQIQNIE